MSIPRKPVEKFIQSANRVEAREIVTTIRLRADFAERIDAAAKRLNLSRSGWIRYAMSKELERVE